MNRTLRIGLDAHMVGGRETGNETYVRGLVEGFSELDRDFDLSVFHVGKAWRAATGKIRFRPLATGSAWLRLGFDLPLQAWRDGLDVVHTSYTAPLWLRGTTVVSVHDICYVTNPEWFSARDLRVLSRTVPWSIRSAARIITGSQVCRDQIIEHYRASEEQVVCIPDAAGPAAAPLSLEEARLELSRLGLSLARPYVLAVGNLQPRKNLVRLIAAFREVVAAGVDTDLVIAGPEHYQAKEVLSAAREASDRIRFTGYLSDRQLAACYRGAEVFAFPSLFEGFGIPALEAMAHGVPVVCSRAGSLPEVCGDAALYFDPLRVESISEALHAVLRDGHRRSKLAAAGRARQEQFTWKQTAEQTLAVYEAAA